MKEITVNEKIVVKDPVTTSEVVALPGIKGEKGDPFTYDDFTPEQIAELQRPAKEAAKVAIASAQRAENAAESVQSAVEDAEQASQSAQQAATAAQEAVTNANTAIGKAETAINNANTAVESVNKLETRVEQAEATRVQSETQRQTAETNRASSEQQREANETERQQKFAQIESDATSLANSLNNAEAKRVSAENAREEAETQRETAEQERTTQFSEIKTEAETLIAQTTEAKDEANSAATSATNAAGAANTAAGLANEAAANANQVADNVDGRVTALESKASQTYENLAAIEASGETNPDKIFIDAETNTSYRWNGTEFVSIGGGSSNTPIPFCWGDDNILNSTFTITQNVIYNSKYDTYLSFGSNSWECFFYPRKGEGKLILNNGKIIKPTLDKITDDLFVIGYKGGLAVISFETQSVVYQRDDFEVANSLIVQYSETEDLILVGDGNKLYTLSRDLATKTQIKEYTNPIIGISRRLESFQNTLSILTSDIVDAYSEGAIQKSVIHEIANAKFSNIIVNRTQGISIVVVSDDEIGIIDMDDTLRKYNLVYQGIKAAWCVTNDAWIAMYVPEKRGIVRYRMWNGAFNTKTEFQDVLFPYDYSNVNQYYLPVTGYICFGNGKNIKTTKI